MSEIKYNVTLDTGFTFPAQNVKKGYFTNGLRTKKTGPSIDVTYMDGKTHYYHPEQIKDIRKV